MASGSTKVSARLRALVCRRGPLESALVRVHRFCPSGRSKGKAMWFIRFPRTPCFITATSFASA